MKNIIRIFIFIMLTGCFSVSCDSYLDVVPDNIATIDNAFTDRNQAEKFLYTLYSYLPHIGKAGVEGRYDDLTWSGRTTLIPNTPFPLYALRDGNRASNPYCNNWSGSNGGTPFYEAIRNCNILLEKIEQVRDLDMFEKIRWIAEAKFLKAYFHFLLLQQYGPIHIIDVNLPVSASAEEQMLERVPVDEAFTYIIGLIDEATPDLPLSIEDGTIELGRITQAAALAVKAKIAVTAASPLFNGNSTYAAFKNSQGQPFFSDYDHEKWAIAATACKEAIDACHEAGHGLYEYQTSLSPETQKILQVGRIYTDKWNKEHVWGMVWPGGINGELDQYTGAALTSNHNEYFRGVVNPTMKAVEMFYSSNGVPIEEDLFYDYENRYETVLTSAVDNTFVQTGYETARLHLNREYRFYGSIAFDGGWWYGYGRLDEDNQWPVNTKSGGASGQRGTERYSCSGFYIKKLLSIESSFSNTSYIFVRSDYPIIRLADLYLLYAEALNEYEGPDGARKDDLFFYINEVRKRAGLETVQYSWTNYAKNPEKYTTPLGMRDIIRRERSIELMFETHRLFDLRRWNIATAELTGPVRGWNYMESSTEDFYQLSTIDNVLYIDRDVLAPIPSDQIVRSSKLVQNPGW